MSDVKRPVEPYVTVAKKTVDQNRLKNEVEDGGIMARSISILLVVLLVSGCASVPISRNKNLSLANKIVCGGGGSDKEGILWSPVGSFWEAEGEDTIKNMEKYCKWWPFVSEESMVTQGSEVPIPEYKLLRNGAMKEYQRLLKISHKRIVEIDGKLWVKREFNK